MTKQLPARAAVTDIVWLQTGFIGDIVLSTGAFALARAEFPAARHHLITTAIGVKALEGAPGLASLIVFDKKGGALRAFRAVRDQLWPRLASPDGTVLVQPHRSHRSGFLARFLGLPAINYQESAFGGYAAARVARVAVMNEAARVALLLEPLGVEREKIAAAVPHLDALALDPESAVARLLAGPGRLFAVAPGSVWGTKRWTPEGFTALVKALLAENPDARVVFVGSQTEAPLVATIAAGLEAAERARTLDLAGKTSLADLRRVFPRFALLVSNDSSPLHFAAAFDVPTVAIFGATVPEMGFGPLASKRRVVGLSLPCRPCSDHGPETCPLGHFKCMRGLKPEAVLQACREILA